MSTAKVVVIAGATSPTGHAIARRFSSGGSSLALFSRDRGKLVSMINKLALSPERVLIETLDFRQPEAAQEAASLVKKQFHGCDVLINLIGGWISGKLIDEFESTDYATMLDQHFWTTLYLVRAFLPLLRLSKQGRVFVVSSPSAALPPAKSAPYAVAKAAQETLLLALAQEIKGSSLTANILRVNAIDTQGIQQPEQPAQATNWTTPEEISETIYFLCQESAKLINGARIPLFGSP